MENATSVDNHGQLSAQSADEQSATGANRDVDMADCSAGHLASVSPHASGEDDDGGEMPMKQVEPASGDGLVPAKTNGGIEMPNGHGPQGHAPWSYQGHSGEEQERDEERDAPRQSVPATSPTSVYGSVRSRISEDGNNDDGNAQETEAPFAQAQGDQQTTDAPQPATVPAQSNAPPDAPAPNKSAKPAAPSSIDDMSWFVPEMIPRWQNDMDQELLKILSTMERIRCGHSVLPPSIRDQITAAAQHDPKLQDIKDRCFAESDNAVAEVPTISQVNEVYFAATECNAGYSSGGWNIGLHVKVLELVADNVFSCHRRTVVQTIPCAAAMTTALLRRGTEENGMVDFCLIVDSELITNSTMSVVGRKGFMNWIDEINYLRGQIPEYSINHSGYKPLCHRPIGLSIKAKHGPTGQSLPQFGRWLDAQWRHLEQLTLLARLRNPNADPYLYQLPRFLPSVYVDGHGWFFIASIRREGRTHLAAMLQIGSTDRPLGIYSVIRALQFLVGWIHNSYWPFLQRLIAGINVERPAPPPSIQPAPVRAAPAPHVRQTASRLPDVTTNEKAGKMRIPRLPPSMYRTIDPSQVPMPRRRGPPPANPPPGMEPPVIRINAADPGAGVPTVATIVTGKLPTSAALAEIAGMPVTPKPPPPKRIYKPRNKPGTEPPPAPPRSPPPTLVAKRSRNTSAPVIAFVDKMGRRHEIEKHGARHARKCSACAVRFQRRAYGLVRYKQAHTTWECNTCHKALCGWGVCFETWHRVNYPDAKPEEPREGALAALMAAAAGGEALAAEPADEGYIVEDDGDDEEEDENQDVDMQSEDDGSQLGPEERSVHALLAA